MAIRERLYASVIGWGGWSFRVISSKAGVRYIDLRRRSVEDLSRLLSGTITPDDRHNETVLAQLHEYLEAQRRTFDVPLDLRGTSFQQAVWDRLLHIPYGETRSYAEVAASIGRPTALRAVGRAVGANPVSIVIPCHRVIGKDGSLVGYGGGLPLKERLLALEQGSLDL